MSRRRLRRRVEKAQRHTPPSPASAVPGEVVREATRVGRLAYTRTQAAEALGVSRSTFDRRVLPFIETMEMPWGTRLVPIDELKRMTVERRRPARRAKAATKRGRPPVVPAETVERIGAGFAAGKSLAAIARELNRDVTPTAHGGKQWWPSSVRAVLRRTAGDQES